MLACIEYTLLGHRSTHGHALPVTMLGVLVRHATKFNCDGVYDLSRAIAVTITHDIHATGVVMLVYCFTCGLPALARHFNRCFSCDGRGVGGAMAYAYTGTLFAEVFAYFSMFCRGMSLQFVSQ